MREKTTVFLAATAQDCAAAQRCGGPCVRLIYRVGDGGILQRAQAPLAGRGGLLGLYEAPGLPAAQPEKLARDLQAECARRGFSGVVLDLEPTAEMLPRLEELCAALRQALSQESYRAMEPEVLGPAPAPVVKLNNRYRYRITVVGQNEKPLRQLLAAYMKAFARRPEHRNMAVHTDCNLMD